MQTITQHLEKEIPNGPWCYAKGNWCKYHERKKPEVDEQGIIRSNFCHLSEEFVTHKTCGINE